MEKTSAKLNQRSFPLEETVICEILFVMRFHWNVKEQQKRFLIQQRMQISIDNIKEIFSKYQFLLLSLLEINFLITFVNSFTKRFKFVVVKL